MEGLWSIAVSVVSWVAVDHVAPPSDEVLQKISKFPILSDAQTNHIVPMVSCIISPPLGFLSVAVSVVSWVSGPHSGPGSASTADARAKKARANMSANDTFFTFFTLSFHPLRAHDLEGRVSVAEKMVDLESDVHAHRVACSFFLLSLLQQLNMRSTTFKSLIRAREIINALELSNDMNWSRKRGFLF